MGRIALLRGKAYRNIGNFGRLSPRRQNHWADYGHEELYSRVIQCFDASSQLSRVRSTPGSERATINNEM